MGSYRPSIGAQQLHAPPGFRQNLRLPDASDRARTRERCRRHSRGALKRPCDVNHYMR
jgi:hypothetical protein